ncbi:MAG: tetratricopeptide repeat protein [Kiritimatiellia bacterium]
MNLKNNPELLPLIEWWEKDGRQTVVYLLVAAIAVGGWYGWKGHRAAVKAAAADALVTAYTTEELEEAVTKFSGTDTAGALRIRLAKSYFDAGRYEDALAQYEDLVGKAPDGFADIPVVGRAQCLEALGKFDEAAKAFDAFAEANPKNYLTLTAQLGAVRCFAQGGDKQKALARVDALKAANKGEELATARIEAIEQLVTRFGQTAAPAVPQAEAAQPAPPPAAKPVAPKAEAKPAVPQAAEAKPAAK